MSITELGAFGEFTASIAVLLTLIVLILESRRNSKLLIRSNSKQIYIYNGQTLETLLEPHVTEIFLRGHNQGMDALDPTERYRFDLAFVPWVQSCELAFADYRDGYFPEDQIAVFKNSVKAWLTTPGGAQWWHERDVWFGRNFREEVRHLLAEQIEEADKAGPIPRKMTVANDRVLQEDA